MKSKEKYGLFLEFVAPCGSQANVVMSTKLHASIPTETSQQTIDNTKLERIGRASKGIIDLPLADR